MRHWMLVPAILTVIFAVGCGGGNDNPEEFLIQKIPCSDTQFLCYRVTGIGNASSVGVTTVIGTDGHVYNQKDTADFKYESHVVNGEFQIMSTEWAPADQVFAVSKDLGIQR